MAKILPKVCPQCGGAVEISDNIAKCPYCGTTFEVDEENTTKTVLNFIGKQMSESREAKKELKKQEKEQQAQFIKIFLMIFAGMFVLGVVAMILMNIFDIG